MIGKPVVAGTRITVPLILEKLAAGETIEQILDEHPRLSLDPLPIAPTAPPCYTSRCPSPAGPHPRFGRPIDWGHVAEEKAMRSTEEEEEKPLALSRAEWHWMSERRQRRG